MPGAGEPTREEVFAFIDAAKGRGAADAVAHFAAEGRSIEASKIRTWLTRRRAAEGRSGVAHVAARQGAEGEKRAGDRPPKRAPTRPSSAPRARDPAADAARLDQLGPELKRQIRGGVRGLGAMLETLDGLADEVRVLKANPKGGAQLRVLDMKQYLHAADTLQKLLEIAPGIDALDQQTGGKEAGASAEEAAEAHARVAAAMGVDPKAGPIVRLVGGREAKS